MCTDVFLELFCFEIDMKHGHECFDFQRQVENNFDNYRDEVLLAALVGNTTDAVRRLPYLFLQNST